jgi:hypothetical protein
MKAKSIRQQFSLSSEVEKELERLGKELLKNPNEIKREWLNAASKLSAKNYFVALGKVQEIQQERK